MGLFGEKDKSHAYKKLITKTDGLIYLSGNYLRYMPERIGGESSWVSLRMDDLEPDFYKKMIELVEVFKSKYGNMPLSDGEEIQLDGVSFFVKQRSEDIDAVRKYQNDEYTEWDLMVLSHKSIEFGAFFDSENKGIIFAKPKTKKIVGDGVQLDVPFIRVSKIPSHEGLGFLLGILTVDDVDYKSYLPARLCFRVADNVNEMNDRIWFEIKMPDIETVHTIGITLIHHKLKSPNQSIE